MSLTWADDTLEVYTEASGTFTFNDSDVEWAYVDWDDGDDNSLEKAIYQWKELETDSNTVTLTHTYTKTGSFYPVIRTVNSTGFLSKYFYDNNKSDNTTIPKPKQEVTNISGMTVSDGNPFSVLKIENKSVKSDIDNSIFEEGPKEVFISVPPFLASGNAVLDKTCTLKVKYVEASIVFVGVDATNTGNYDIGYERIVKEVEKNIDLYSGTSAISTSLLGSVVNYDNAPKKILEILDVRLTTPRIDTSINSVRNDFNKLKFFLIAQGDDSKWYPITYVSNGDPIKKAEDRRATLDFSQSRAKASNTSIDDYKFDSGKVFWTPEDQWQAASSTGLTNTTKTTSSLFSTSYTYYTRPGGLIGSSSIGGSSSVGFVTGSNFYYVTATTSAFIRDQFLINEYNQFYDQYHLARITASSSGVKDSTLDTFEGMYRITPAISTSANADYFLDTNTTTTIQTSASYYNNSGNIINTDNWNGVIFESNEATVRPLSEYFIITNDVKTNKIFFNNTPYAKDFMSDLTTTTSGNKVAGVYYLKLGEKVEGDKFTQTAEWMPVKFKDTTKVSKEIRDSTNSKYVTYEESMTKPGFIEFDMPSDWSQVSISGLCGGLFNVTSAAVISESDDYSKHIAATYVTNQALTPYLNKVAYVLSTTNLSGYTDEQIGNFKYTYQYSGGDASTPDVNATYWVVSSSVANNKLFLLSSSVNEITGLVSGEAFGGVMRRVNAYEVFDGATKIINGAAGTVPNGDADPYPYTFMWSGSTFIDDLQANFVDVYPLKIVLSGPYPDENTSLPTLASSSHFVSGSTRTGMEMWNALPYNNSYSQVVIQRDNTAYDLSYMEITSDVSMAYAGTFYQAISKKGKVFIKRTGTSIQNINFGGTAMGDEQSFSFNEDYTSYGTLRLLRRIEAEDIRVMWDEQQKDSTYVRFFGYVSNVNETHQVTGKRASRPFSFTMVIEEICLLDANGNLMSDVEPLGGSPDDKKYE